MHVKWWNLHKICGLANSIVPVSTSDSDVVVELFKMSVTVEGSWMKNAYDSVY